MICTRVTRILAGLLVVALLAALAFGVTGCAKQEQASTATPMKAQPVAAQTCANCGGKGMAPMTMGEATQDAGVQVIKVGVRDGYYSPNQFAAKAGTPIKVTFSGKAEGCLGMPKFPSLNKKADFTKTGEATIDLGTLKPGTYEFTCGMDMTGGKIVVQ